MDYLEMGDPVKADRHPLAIWIVVFHVSFATKTQSLLVCFISASCSDQNQIPMNHIAGGTRGHDFRDDLSQVSLGGYWNEAHVLRLHALNDKERSARPVSLRVGAPPATSPKTGF
jgi:hypothetical protein